MRDFHIAAMLFGRLQLGNGAHLFHARLTQIRRGHAWTNWPATPPLLLVEIPQRRVSAYDRRNARRQIGEVAASFF